MDMTEEALIKAIYLFKEDKKDIEIDIAKNIMDELKEEDNRKEFDDLERRLINIEDTKTFRDFYSFKMIRRKSDFIKGIAFDNFNDFFLDSLELNKDYNFAKNIFEFLTILRKQDKSEMFPDGKENIEDRLIALMSSYITEEYNKKYNLNYYNIYNIMVATYIDMYIFFYKEELMNGNNILELKEESNEIKLFSESYINDFLNESIKATEIFDEINSSILKNFPPQVKPDINSLLHEIKKQASKIANENNVDMSLVNTLIEYKK
ncbi:hypothetical protein CPT_Machias_055 [Staphylococcus phage Machias]|nr:hypothetical protein CPT_Machias_055 [Staphylococcus phage Machias]